MALPLDEATYVPPPAERLWECLDPLEKSFHAAHELPPLITLACLHYQFEAIHPFVDGNGRVGRLLVVLLLVEWGLLPLPLLDLSAYIEARRDEYYAGLLRVSTEGRWLEWVQFFLTAVREQATDVVRRAQRLQQLRDEYRGRVATARSSGLLARLVDNLFETPALTINRARDVLGVTHRAATLNVEKLADAGIVSELQSGGRQRVFLAVDILRALEGA